MIATAFVLAFAALLVAQVEGLAFLRWRAAFLASLGSFQVTIPPSPVSFLDELWNNRKQPPHNQ